MSSNLDSIDRSLVCESQTQRREFVERAKQRWRKTGTPDAAAVLAKHDWIRDDRSLALELAYEDYCVRIDNGELVDPNVFCQRFPSLRRSLSRQIEVDQFVRAHRDELARPVDPDWPQPDDPLLGFRVVEVIGTGAFARAYLCAQSDVGDRQVVVKVAYQGAFEADTMGRLSHPNIMSVHSIERDLESQLSCLCMPFCGRSTLCDVIDLAFAGEQQPSRSRVILDAARSRIRRGDRYQPVISRMTVQPGSSYVTGILQLAIQIAEALEHSHSRGVMHGDLKPSNVVLSIDAMPLVVDFNLSLGPGAAALTTGGTFPYMAPEKARALLVGPDDTDLPDGRSDIFSLGAMLHELFTGRIPFLDSPASEDPMTLGTRILDLQSQGLPRLTTLNPIVDAGLADFIHDCVAFEPANRPQSMTEVCSELRRHLSRSRRSYRFLRARRRIVLLTAMGLVGGLIGVAAYRALGPSVRDQYYADAVQQYHRKQYVGAIEDFTLSLEADSSFFEAYFGRACAGLHLHAQDSRPETLQSVYRDLHAAGSIRNGTPRVDVAWSIYYLRTGDFGTAVNAMESVIESEWETAEIRNNLGYACSKLGAFQTEYPINVRTLVLKAESNYRRAIELDGQLWQAHLNLAMLELRRFRNSEGQHRPDDGLRSIRFVVKQNPSDTATFFFAAKLAGVIADSDDDAGLWNECIDYLDQAQQRGCDLQSIKKSHPFTALASHPRFVELLDRVPVDRPQTAADRVAMPSSILSPP